MGEKQAGYESQNRTSMRAANSALRKFCLPVICKADRIRRKQNYKKTRTGRRRARPGGRTEEFQTPWMFQPTIPLIRPQGPGFWPCNS